MHPKGLSLCPKFLRLKIDPMGPKIVRLFLREDLRDHFEELVREIGGSYSLNIKERAGKMVKVKEEIQKILEEHIKNPKW